ncbi:MAG: xanthine dehydrogenase family protein molybdopterin-binding subunit, partial [Kordiimonadaceae bacterium]|nr:xanthine dehydrogenase family protein molybdopterin-binding subunit [Kordiimonadaceae bacterium]
VDFTQLGFFSESFIDELAHKAGADPLDFRLAHTSDPRRSAVLERLKVESGWADAPAEGRARGVAIITSFETIVGQVVETSVDDDGGVRVHKVISVVDCGRVINPDGAEAQVQGSVIYALTAALFGEITLEGGEVQQKNFPDYDMLRLANAPEQHVVFMENDIAPGGLGEPGVPAVAPALTNAIFAASGKRVRSLPLSADGFYAV